MKKYTINKDFKKLKKGQEVNLTDELAGIFKGKGLIGEIKKPEPKKEFTPKSKGNKKKGK